MAHPGNKSRSNSFLSMSALSPPSSTAPSTPFLLSSPASNAGPSAHPPGAAPSGALARYSVPSTPLLSIPNPSPSPSPSFFASPARKLLMPTVRPPRPTPPSASNSPVGPSPLSPKSPRPRPAAATKLMRARSASVNTPPLPAPALPPPPPRDAGKDWLGRRCRFDVVQDLLELEGYQIYAVEKW